MDLAVYSLKVANNSHSIMEVKGTNQECVKSGVRHLVTQKGNTYKQLPWRGRAKSIHSTMIQFILLACLPLATSLLISTSRTNYHLTTFTTPYSNASSYCNSLGMRLARLSETDFDQIKAGMGGKGPDVEAFWIDKWNGTNTISGVERCLAVYRPGAVVVPSDACEEAFGVICEELVGIKLKGWE